VNPAKNTFLAPVAVNAPEAGVAVHVKMFEPAAVTILPVCEVPEFTTIGLCVTIPSAANGSVTVIVVAFDVPAVIVNDTVHHLPFNT
jgi:hypothetical protein